MAPAALDEFHQRAGRLWAESIESLGLGAEASAAWTDLDAIEGALRPFMGRGLNHAHFPTGGGLDFLELARFREPGCLEAATDDRSAEVFKPRRLVLERFTERPQESFLLLELEDLGPTGLYERDPQGQEELVDVPGRGYLRREAWDRGFLGHDEEGREVPLPEEARLVSRWLGGKILIVANGSLWNGTPNTYDGRHAAMTATEIRRVIERALARRDGPGGTV